MILAHRDEPDDGDQRRIRVEVLLNWFETNRRAFPWRGQPSAYEIAVAEVLLQKTSAKNVLPVFDAFIRSFPTIERLALADREVVAAIIQPLGIPRRARLLVEMGRTVVEKWAGMFPRTTDELATLPGIGPYGAAAIASIAFGEQTPMIDINVMRIIERVFSIPYTPRSGPSRRMQQFVGRLLPPNRASDFNLALLDFGALVCQRRTPRCDICPLTTICAYYGRTASRHRVVGQQTAQD